jgi:hypothetical protein
LVAADAGVCQIVSECHDTIMVRDHSFCQHQSGL